MRAPLSIAIVAGCAVAVGCADRPASPARPALTVAAFAVMPLAGPRADDVLVPGEAVRVVVRVRGGTPPYTATLQPPLDGTAELPAADPGAEVALATALPPDAAAGPVRLAVAVTDAAGASAKGHLDAAVADIRRHVDPTPPVAPYVRVMDDSGRARTGGYRGERLAIAADIADAALPARVQVIGPGGSAIADAALSAPRDDVVLQVPPLAVTGVYRIELSAGGAPRAAATWRVLGPAFPAATALAIDDLRVWGGPALWSPRGGALRAGERVRVSARVAGARGSLHGVLTLRDRAGKAIAASTLGTAPPRSVRPDARIFAETAWDVPRVAPGPYVLEIELVQDAEVAKRLREVRIE